MTMHNPGHPGEVIREACLKPLGLTVTEAAAGLGVTRKALSDLVNGHSGVSPDMAVRLENAGWGTADSWLQMQLNRDLWEARERAAKIKVKRICRPATVKSFSPWHEYSQVSCSKRGCPSVSRDNAIISLTWLVSSTWCSSDVLGGRLKKLQSCDGKLKRRYRANGDRCVEKRRRDCPRTGFPFT